MLATITQAMADQSINIDEIRSSHDPRSGESVAVLKVNQPVPDDALAKILSRPGFQSAVAVSI